MDVYEPLTPSQGAATLIATFLDDHAIFSYVEFCKSKREVQQGHHGLETTSKSIEQKGEAYQS